MRSRRLHVRSNEVTKRPSGNISLCSNLADCPCAFPSSLPFQDEDALAVKDVSVDADHEVYNESARCFRSVMVTVGMYALRLPWPHQPRGHLFFCSREGNKWKPLKSSSLINLAGSDKDIFISGCICGCYTLDCLFLLVLLDEHVTQPVGHRFLTRLHGRNEKNWDSKPPLALSSWAHGCNASLTWRSLWYL